MQDKAFSVALKANSRMQKKEKDELLFKTEGPKTGIVLGNSSPFAFSLHYDYSKMQEQKMLN